MIRQFFRFLRLLVKFNPRWLAVRTVFVVLISLIPLGQLVIAQRIIDQIVTGLTHPAADHWSTIISLILLEGLLYLANLVINTIDQKYDDIFSERLRLHMEELILVKAASLDVQTYDEPDFHNRIEKLHSEIYWRPVSLYQTSYEILGSVTTLAGTIGLFLLLPSWIIGFLVIVAIPVFWLQTKYGLAIHKLDDDFREDYRRATYFSWLLIDRPYIQDTKLYQLGSTFIDQVRRVWGGYITAHAAIAKRYLVYELVSGTLALFVRVGILVWLARAAVNRLLTIGQFTLYGNLIGQLAGSITGLLSGLARIGRFRQFLSDLTTLRQRQPIIVDALRAKPLSANRPGIIRFENVSFRYPGQKTWALRHVSFTIEPGHHLALVGENGAGKTTIVKLLARFYDPTEGRITINGLALDQLRLHDLHRYLGIIFQDFARYQARVRENIGYGNLAQQTRLPRIRQAALRSGADPFIRTLPEHYETLLAREFDKGTELSGGQWQKIALARTFFRDARLLVLDEPTAALDATAEEHFYRQFLRLRKDTSAILISHRFSTVRMANQILVLEKGRVVEEGSHSELIKKNGRYAKLFHLQAARYK